MPKLRRTELALRSNDSLVCPLPPSRAAFLWWVMGAPRYGMAAEADMSSGDSPALSEFSF